MWRDVSFRVGESAEVNDVFDPCLFCSECECMSGVQFEGCVSMSVGHVVDQVIGGVNAFERIGKR